MHDDDALSWFEIPTADLARATRFYAAVLAQPLREEHGFGEPMAIFPYTDPGVGGCLREDAAAVRAGGGALVFLKVDALDAAIARALAAGGRLLQPRTDLPAGMGAFAHIEDSEGNRVGLHAAA
mgnify:CR=1 FL=1